jgi:hypothetical protein
MFMVCHLARGSAPLRPEKIYSIFSVCNGVQHINVRIIQPDVGKGSHGEGFSDLSAVRQPKLLTSGIVH